jgi:hypothetical protein
VNHRETAKQAVLTPDAYRPTVGLLPRCTFEIKNYL